MERKPGPERDREQWAAHSLTKMAQTGGLDSHRWLDTHKRSIMKPEKEQERDKEKRREQEFGAKNLQAVSFLYHSNNDNTHKYEFVYLK